MRHYWQRVMLASCTFSGFIYFPLASFAQTAIAPDSTLPANTVVNFNPTTRTYTITGGTERGVNQFQSFSNFSIPSGNAAFFNSASQIINVIGRVTGTDTSRIDGLLRTNGTTNLFLINPNGIIFGAGAQLNIGGSFTASTANSFKFPDGSEFSATNPQAPPLLSVNVPIGLQFNSPNPAAITNAGNLKLGRDLTLSAGSVTNTGTLDVAKDLKLESVGGNLIVSNSVKASTATLTSSKDIELKNATIITTGNLNLTATTGVVTLTSVKLDTSTSTRNVNAGNINISAKDRVNINASNIRSEVRGVQANGGLITLKAGALDLKTSTLSTDMRGIGTGGDIRITATAGNVTLENVTVNSSTFGNGNAGNINIDASKEFLFTGGAKVLSNVAIGAIGNAGTIRITAPTISFTGVGTRLSSTTTGNGNAGNININATKEFSFTGGAKVLSKVQKGATGNAGNVSITAPTVSFINPSTLSGTSKTSLNSGTSGNGNAGNININATKEFSLKGGAIVLNNVEKGATGNGGDIIITAPTISVTGAETELSSSGLSSISKLGKGNAGKITLIATKKVEFSEGASIFNTIGEKEITTAIGTGGQITIEAPTVSFTDGSMLSSTTFGKGNAGNVTIIASDSISFSSSTILTSVGTTGEGDAGSIMIDAPKISFTGGSQLSSSTIGKGNAGNIELNTRILAITGGSEVLAETQSTGAGGNITVNASTAVNLTRVLDSSPVLSVQTSNAGKAGSIIINTPILNLSEQARITATATVTSTNTDGGGSITLNASELNLSGTVGIFAETAGVAPAGTLTFKPYRNDSSLRVTLTTGSQISASTSASGNGGDLIVTAPQTINLAGKGKLAVETSGTGNAGNISFSTQQLTLTDGVSVSASTTGTGKAGDISVDANNFTLSNGAKLLTTTIAQGNAGNILLNTPISTITGGSQVLAETSGTGTGGNITVNASTAVNLMRVLDSSPVLSVQTSNAGKAGNIVINTPTLNLSEQARITATATKDSTNTDGGGSITLNASTLNLSGTVGIFAETAGVAPAGTLTFKPYRSDPSLRVTLTTGSQISASTSASGNGGDVIVTAPQTINLAGKGKLAVETSGTGNAGNIRFSTQQLTLTDGVLVSASTTGTGKAGDISVDANNFTLSNGAKLLTTTSSIGDSGTIDVKVVNNLVLTGATTGLFANTDINSTGKGGSIIIDPQLVSITNGAAISVNSLGTGNGGNIDIITNKLTFANNALITANTASGEGGNINLQISDIFFPRNNSSINATAGGKGNGGNIDLSAQFLISLPSENNNIFANAVRGKGGNIIINTQGIFGFASSKIPTDFTSDITASSQFGLQGNVNINTPGVDPTKGLTNLPVNVTDPSRLVTQRCLADQRGSEFIITGKGGVPANPSDQPASTGVLDNLGTLPNLPTTNLRSSTSPQPTPEAIVEATGYIINAQKQIVLVAGITPSQTKISCPQ